MIDRIAYLQSLLRFAFKENPLLYISIAVSVLSVVLELAAMTALLPIAAIAAGQPLPKDSMVISAGTRLGIPLSGTGLLLTFVVLFALRVITQFVGQGLTLFVSKRMLAQLATRAFATLVTSVPLKDVERATIGSYITLVGDESFRASNLVVYLNQFVALALLSALYFFAVLTYSPQVGIAVLVFLVLSFVVMFESFRMSHRLGVRQVEESHSANSIFMDALNGLRSVRAFAAEKYVSGSYRNEMRRYMRTLFAVDLTSLLTRLGPAILLLATVAIVAISPSLRNRMALDFPLLITVVIFLLRFFPVVGQALGIALRVVADARAGRDVTRLIQDRRESIKVGERVGTIQKIQAINLGFWHHADRPVLQDFNVTLDRGKCYAMVGVSGSGKSSFLDLLLGFYPFDEGALLINNVPTGRIALTELRARILLVSQETTIFNDTVANNLRFGSDASMEQIREACEIACIDDFISQLPKGYDTLLTYRGSNLSGGQKQRIGIARALVRRPDVMLLDESTSALDAATRKAVVSNLINAHQTRILLFVTHDAHVIERVDHVFDMALLNRTRAAASSPTSSEPVIVVHRRTEA